MKIYDNMDTYRRKNGFLLFLETRRYIKLSASGTISGQRASRQRKTPCYDHHQYQYNLKRVQFNFKSIKIRRQDGINLPWREPSFLQLVKGESGSGLNWPTRNGGYIPPVSGREWKVFLVSKQGFSLFIPHLLKNTVYQATNTWGSSESKVIHFKDQTE